MREHAQPPETACRRLTGAGMAIKRPNPALWLYYQYSGKLPATYREWVLHDGTCGIWMLRVLVRGLVHIAPIVTVMLTVLVVYGGSWSLALGPYCSASWWPCASR